MEKSEERLKNLERKIDRIEKQQDFIVDWILEFVRTNGGKIKLVDG